MASGRPKTMSAAANNLRLVSDSPDEPSSDLSAILDGCQRGDREMQRELYERCHRQVFRLAVRMVGRQDAADVCQLVFLKMFQSIDQYAGRANFTTWLYRIALNECLQHRRKRGRHPTVHLADYEPPDRQKPATQRLADHELLETALDRIDPELRSLFLLREVEELSYSELASVLDLPEGTIASRLNRARDQLHTILQSIDCDTKTRSPNQC
jgi:RNA polymerase sigma-70 factor (ECF subfamily)